MASMPTPPPGFDPEPPYDFIAAPRMPFLMPRSWADPRLSLAAVGALARIAVLEKSRSFEFGELCRDEEQARAVMAELADAGILVDGTIIDPDRPSPRHVKPPVLPRPKPITTVVYYLQREPDQAIKIGLSGNLEARIERLIDVYGPLALLASEIGAKREEQARHRQFWKLRLPHDRRFEGGSEWFRPGRALILHIRSTQASSAEVAA